MAPPRRGTARSASRRLSPQSPAKTAPQPSSPTTRRSGRGATRDTAHAPSALPLVTEASEYQEASAGPVEDEIQDLAPSQTPSDVSSDSQGELEALSYDLILDSLPDLRDESVKLLKNFQEIDVSTLLNYIVSLRDPTAPSTRRCSIQLKKLLATREAFGGRVWALPSIIVRKLRSGVAWSDIPDGMWRPDAILYLSNLAQFVAALCLTNAGNAALMDTFSFFPLPFSPTTPLERLTTHDIQGLLETGDELRTQLFIHEARTRLNQANFDPDLLLAGIFFEDDYESRIAPLVAQIGQPYSDQYQNRLKQIRSTFTKNSKNPIQLEKLEKAFPWNQFVSQTVQWAVLRLQELEAAIDAQPGGAVGIAEAIKSGNFNLAPYAAGQVTTGDPPMARNVAKRAGRGGRGGRQHKNVDRNINALRKAKDNLAARKSAPVSANMFENEDNAAAAALLEYNQSTDDAYAPAIDDEAGLPNSGQGPQSPIQLSEETRRAQVELAVGVLNEQRRQANKENVASREITKSYLDPQQGASRVGWGSEDDVAGPSGPKRRQTTAETDEDGEFEEDARPQKWPRYGRGKGRATPEPSPVLDQQYPYPSTQQPYPSTQRLRSPLREHMRPPPSTAPVSFGTQLPAGTPYGEINQKAKLMVAATRERDNRHIVQQRRAWTEDEVVRLIDAIAMNQGPKYAKILKDDKDDRELFPDGPKLQHRTQVQLKDKARNIKMDYLKARQRLPDGFASVSIGKRMVESLRGMGIDYVEGDLEATEGGIDGSQDE